MKRGINKGLLAVGALTGVTVLTGAVLSRPVVKADGLNTDDVTITIQTSCTITVDQSESSQHSAEIENGRAVSDIGVTRMGAYCNDKNGYYIYAVGSSGDTDGNTALLSSIGNDFNIATGTATSGNTSNWAMKITGGEGTTAPTVVNAFKNYRAVPETYTVVAHRDSGTEMSPEDLETSGSYIDTTYQTYVTSTQPAGTYRGKVKYTLVHPFDPTKPISINEAFRIAGKTKVTVDGQEYYQMQDMTPAICDMVTVLGDYSKAQLVDTRDNSIYWVAKLGDDNSSDCWMTQNLDLDLISDVNAGNYVALTSNNTDLSTDESVYTASNTIYALKGAGDTYGYTYENGIATWIPERTTIAYNQLNNTNWQNSNTDPYSWDRLETSGTNAGQPVHPDTNVPDEHGLAGNYYNWTASLASNDSTNATGNPTNSICPKGWRLPNVTNKEFGNLLVQYNIISTNTSTSYINGVSSVNSMGASPLYFVRGGYVGGGSLNNSGSYGHYWSSTFYNSSVAYFLQYYSSNVYPQSYGSRYFGRSVRCLARSE